MCTNLNGERISPEERFDWQPDELVAVLGTHRGRHWGEVHSLSVSPGGDRLATGGTDNVVRIWDAKTLHSVAVLEGHAGSVESVTIAPDGRTLVSASDDGTVRLWDLTADPPSARAFNPADDGEASIAFSCAALSPDGKLLAIASRDSEVVWLSPVDGRKVGRAVKLLGNREGVITLAFSPNGRALASACRDGTVRLWELTGPLPQERTVLVAEPDGAEALAFSPTGDTLAACCFEFFRVWRLDGVTFQLRADAGWLPGGGGTGSTVAFSPDGSTLAVTGGEASVQLWDVTGPIPREREQDRIDWNTGPPVVAAFLGNGTLASGSGDGSVRLWNVVKRPAWPRERIRDLPGHRAAATAMAFSGDGRSLASSDGQTVLWDLSGEAAVQRGSLNASGPMTLSPDGRRLAASGVLWCLSDGRSTVQHRFECDFRSAAFCPEGRLLAFVDEYGRPQLFDLTGDAPALVSPLDGCGEGGRFLAFSPDGETLVTCGDRGPVWRWSLGAKPLQSVAVLEGLEATVTLMAYSQGTTLVVVADDGIVRRLSPSGERLDDTFLEGYVSEEGRSLALSPDGRTLVAAGQDGRVLFWDITSGNSTLPAWEFPGAVRGVAFGPDGCLATANADGTIYIVRMPPVSSRAGN